jgi:hypothetical protein
MSKAPIRPPAESIDVGVLLAASSDESACTDRSDVASNFVYLRFRILGREKTKVALEALVCNRRSNKCRIITICQHAHRDDERGHVYPEVILYAKLALTRSTIIQSTTHNFGRRGPILWSPCKATHVGRLLGVTSRML